MFGGVFQPWSTVALVALASLVMFTAEGAANRPRLIAKVSKAFCQPSDADLSTASSTLAVATVSRVSAAVSAVGLSHHSDLPVPCWCLLEQADSAEATQTAVEALLSASAVSVLSDSGNAAAPSTAVFEYIAVDQKRYTSASAGRQLTREGQQPADIPAVSTQLPAGTRIRHRQLRVGSTASVTGSALVPQGLAGPASLPTECSSGTCTRLWGMNRISAPAAWLAIGPVMPNITRKGMIIDTGVDMKHYDIIPQIDVVNSVTFAQGSHDQPAGGVPYKGTHGTHVFGTAAGGWGPYNGQPDPNGIAGVAGPTQNQIVSCNSFGRSNDGAYDSDIIKCLAHARKVKAHYAVNLSLGGLGTKGDAIEQMYKEAFAGLCADGGMAIIAAGNGACVGSGCPKNGDYYRGVNVAYSGLNKDGKTYTPGMAWYPAYMARFYPNCVIVVANIQQDDTLEESSNWGRLVRLAAPGTNILSDVLTSEGGHWAKGRETGTSMSAPHVAGAVILLRNSFPDASNTQVTKCLVSTSERTVKPHWPGSFIGGGILNVKAAYDCMKALFPDVAPAPAPTTSSPPDSPAP